MKRKVFTLFLFSLITTQGSWIVYTIGQDP